jgi:NAD+ synthetase
MKTLICQINTIPNDFVRNYEQIVVGIAEGRRNNADLIVFPELAIPGYLCKDMMFRKDFIGKNLDCLQALPSYLPAGYEPHIVIGYIDRNYSGCGKPFRNMAAVFKGPRLIATYQKHLLPFYDVFDEGRYFAPGTELTVVEICGQKWGICICEDLWNDKGSDDYNYQFNPLEAYRTRGIYNIISINSSPFVRGKPKKRIEMVKQSTDKIGTIIYCNQLGGQDELVFDGNSFIVEKGLVKAVAGMEPYQFYDDANRADQWGSILRDEPYDMIKLGLKDYITKSGFKQVVVGSSGGIDSALVLSLACDAIGPENVHGIRMPTTISSEHSKNDAELLHNNLGCHDHIIPIAHNPFIGHILANLKMGIDPKPIADENIQARLRGMILMYYSNAFDALLLSTGNKTELALGYCTLYGDMNGGFCPINDLYKMQVYDMAHFYNQDGRSGRTRKYYIPENILTKAPSAELAPGQTDEASLLPYPILDAIVEAYVEEFIGDFKAFREYYNNSRHIPIQDWIDSKDAEEKYKRMIRLININEFKRRQAAPGIKITPIAFGIGRRLPICHGR